MLPQHHLLSTRLTLKRGSVSLFLQARRLSVAAVTDKGAAAEHWYRHRTTAESLFRDSMPGAALRHSPVDTRMIAVPGRLIRHGRHLILRLPLGHCLPAEILSRLRHLPAPA